MISLVVLPWLQISSSLTINNRNGWGATAVEALGTAAIMDIPEIVDQILDFIPTIDFTKSKDPVDLFETTIRYLGGMLSSYELLTGPMKHLVRNKVREYSHS